MRFEFDPVEPVTDETSNPTHREGDEPPTVDAEHGQSWRDTDEDPWGTAEEAPPPVIGM
ncbi:hypothetical protein [Stackebrandtia soli]|uniref:hypothetical protein n=1 Tax=Stackebrandtia soli TaxID=1892856 RepID=UPI0039E98FC9